MIRADIISTIGRNYLVSNIENGEFSYVKALRSIGKNIRDFQYNTDGTHHQNIDIRFENDRLVVLVECKNKFSRWDKSEIQRQLQEYVRYEKEYTEKRMVAILAETEGDEVWTWYGGSVIIDDQHRKLKERTIKSFEEYENLCFGKINNKIKSFWGISEVGFSFMSTVETTFFVIFLTDVAQLPLALVAAITSVAGIADAITAMLAGVIIDKVNFKNGKYRPWLIYCPPFVVAFFVLMFTKIGSDPMAALLCGLGYVLSHGIWNICVDINDMFMTNGTNVTWKKRCFEEIKENYDDYIALISALMNYIETDYVGSKSDVAFLVPGSIMRCSDGDYEIVKVSAKKNKILLKLPRFTLILQMSNLHIRIVLICQ